MLKENNMANWVKWWRDSTFLVVMSIAVVAILLGFLMAHYISWGWIITLLIGVIAGISIRKIIIDRLNKTLDEKSRSSQNEIQL